MSSTNRRSINYGLAAPSVFDPTAWFTEGKFGQRIVSQEVRLNYDSERFDWVTGLYAADERNTSYRNQFAINSTFSSVETTSTRNTADIRNVALFGEFTYTFAPQWNVTLGGRLDHYRQDQQAFVEVNDLFAGPVSSSASASSFEETVFIPKVGISYDVDAYNRIALVYQEGYRPGGSGVRLSDGAAFSYDSETAENLELSWRGSVMGGRLNVGAYLFYQDWDNQQVEIWNTPADPTSSFIVNAGKSRSYGGELELDYQASDMLRLYGSVGLLRTEFKNFAVGPLNLSGQPFSNAPERAAVLGFRWGGETGWFAGGNAKYVGSSLSRVETGGNRVGLDSYVTFDAQVGYAWDTVTLTVYATNLFDEKYFTYESGPGTMAAVGDRREIGFRLSKVF